MHSKILILLLLLCLNAQAQNLKPSKDVKKHITPLTKELNTKLFKGPIAQQPIVYIEYSPLHDDVIGLTRQIGPNVFMIDLNEDYVYVDLEWVLMHELVHVWQLSTGQLTKNAKGFVWREKQYSHSTEYLTRPWELHAELLVSRIYAQKKK